MFVAFFALVGFAPAVLAAEDANGTWKWTQQGRGNNATAREYSLTLKVDGEKLTGALTAPGRGNNAAPAPTDISEGKIKDGDLSFKVVRKGQNGDITITYTGKLSGDTIAFTSEMAGGNNNAQPRKFEAKRSK
jgi:hypothetical protein